MQQVIGHPRSPHRWAGMIGGTRTGIRLWGESARMSVTLFRQLLSFYLCLFVLSLALAFFPPEYPADLQEAYDALPAGWLVKNVWLSVCLLVAWLIALVTGVIGLFRLKKWGRTLCLVVTVVEVLINFGLSPILSSPLETALSEALGLFWAALLAATYWSPLSDQFSPRRAEPPPGEQFGRVV